MLIFIEVSGAPMVLLTIVTGFVVIWNLHFRAEVEE